MDRFDLLTIITTITLIISLIFSVISMPFVIELGWKYNILDIPDKRKQHKAKIVRLGGLSIFLGFSISLILIFLALNYLKILSISNEQLIIIFIGCSLFFLLGLAEDIIGINPFGRLFLQTAISSYAFINGIRIEAIDISWLNSGIETYILPISLSFIFTVIWILAITNSINWLDGLDGLAAGFSTISGIGLLIIFALLGKWDITILCASLCGASIGFLRYNFYPSKVLMGDSGSYLIGSTIAIVCITGLSNTIPMNDNLINKELYDLNIFSIQVAFLLLFLPIVDMILVIFERIINGKSPFYPDRRHIHHKLLRTGLHQRSTVILIYAISQFFTSIAISHYEIPNKVILICSATII